LSEKRETTGVCRTLLINVQPSFGKAQRSQANPAGRGVQAAERSNSIQS
jgi:hypothetical protein